MQSLLLAVTELPAVLHIDVGCALRPMKSAALILRQDSSLQSYRYFSSSAKKESKVGTPFLLRESKLKKRKKKRKKERRIRAREEAYFVS